MARAHLDALLRVGLRDVGSINDILLRVDARKLVGGRDHDVIGSAPLVELPWRLEQLKELLDDRVLVGAGNHANHGESTSCLHGHRTGYGGGGRARRFLYRSIDEIADAVDDIPRLLN